MRKRKPGKGTLVRWDDFEFRRHAIHYFHVPGLQYFSTPPTIIDETYALVEADESAPLLALCPRVWSKHSSIEDAAFFAHCLSYLNDTPVSLWPARGQRRALQQPIAGRRVKGDAYYQHLGAMMDLVHGARIGALGNFEFLCDANKDPLRLPLTKRYGHVKDAVAMYAFALRQADPISEFLHYYRILEWVETREKLADAAVASEAAVGYAACEVCQRPAVSYAVCASCQRPLAKGSDGKKWVKTALPRLLRHEFPKLWVQNEDTGQPQNVFALYRRRARARQKELEKKNRQRRQLQLTFITPCVVPLLMGARGSERLISAKKSRKLRRACRS